MVVFHKNKNKIEELFGAPYDHGNRIHQVGYALNSHYVYPTKHDCTLSEEAGSNSSYGSNHHTSDFWHFDANWYRVKYDIKLGYLFDQMGLKK